MSQWKLLVRNVLRKQLKKKLSTLKGHNGIIVSSDGMWRKRRFSSFSSHSGLVTLIGWYISKIRCLC